MFHQVELEGLFAIILSLSIPIVAIVMVFITSIKNKQSETQLRLSLIEHGTEPETAKLLIEQQEKKSNKFGTLRGGCVLLGAGLGAACNGFLGVSSEDMYFWLTVGAGMGIGLLIAFVIEYKLTKKEQRERGEQAAVE
jgi:hypothetical protein